MIFRTLIRQMACSLTGWARQGNFKKGHYTGIALQDSRAIAIWALHLVILLFVSICSIHNHYTSCLALVFVTLARVRLVTLHLHLAHADHPLLSRSRGKCPGRLNEAGSTVNVYSKVSRYLL